jgi:regulator of sigma E protease
MNARYRSPPSRSEPEQRDVSALLRLHMGFLTTILAFVFVLGVIIFVHEFGHLVVAKAFGMRVFVFSFGFGTRLAGFRWGETDCRVSAIPLGGYVKLEGEADDLISEDTSRLGDGRDFLARPRWQRFLVYLAGPTMNAVLTVGVWTVLNVVGTGFDASAFDRPIIGAVTAGSPAEKAGLLPGDEILAINNVSFPDWERTFYYIALRPGETLALRVLRQGEVKRITVRSEATAKERVGQIGVHPLVRVGEVIAGAPAGEAGLRTNDAILEIDGQPIATFVDIPPLVQGAEGRPLSFRIWRDGKQLDMAITPRDDGSGPWIGIRPKYVLRRFSPGAAVVEAVRSTWKWTRQTIEVIGRLVTARISPKTMMGPLGIAQVSGDAARGGPLPLFNLVAIISLQVGILNLLPLAPLDGGHLAILAVEGTARRDLSPGIKNWILNAGAAVIFLLIGLVLYSDISKLEFVRNLIP